MQERRTKRRSFVKFEHIDDNNYLFAYRSGKGPLIETGVTDRGREDSSEGK